MELREASSEFLPFQFDADKLQKLQEALPSDLQFLRLRLRFGFPVEVEIGQKFRIVVDLVDEMGQPVPEEFAPPNGINIFVISQISTCCNSPTEDQLVLKIEDKLTTEKMKHRRTKWVFLASFRSSISQVSSRASETFRVTLSIQMQKDHAKGDHSDDCRQLLQNFCAGSDWVSEKVLVLPLQVDVHVTRASLNKQNVRKPTSTSCQRVFCVSRGMNTMENRILVIEENYGDAMGSHVWDASILLSFVVLQAGIVAPNYPEKGTSSKSKMQSMLELGSGCGLFATVLVNLLPSCTKMTTIFTEKSECTERLRVNLERNCSPQSAIVLPLEWGMTLPDLFSTAVVSVVFAADVLYNWAAHEAFLATLDALVHNQKSSTNLQVFVAHKRRGKASASNLRDLASGAFDFETQCGVRKGSFSCRWTHWRTQKLVSFGPVDLFKLTLTVWCKEGIIQLSMDSLAYSKTCFFWTRRPL
ncbi:Nicotinamide N-methyltransferase [Phytophthora megakarya]|uniref:Nicotinamide N-methyltransferase n=1 Tax=Phytophthora megakarya TaxID=4795 RepID=A0A225WUM3_9STRA|nr:Nicotinamide N-methyltransferase [Phytophthora megakarya]